jgi:hypothetical protein
MKKTFRECVLNHDFQYFVQSVGAGETMLGLIHLATLLLRRVKRPNFSSYLHYRSAALTKEDRFA